MADCLVLIIVLSGWPWRHQTYQASLATSRFRPSEGHCETVFVSVRGHQASTGRRHIRTFLVLKSCHGQIKINNMHLSQFSTNFKLRIYKKPKWQKIKSQILIMFLVKLLKFGQNFCPNGHVVSFLRQKQWWSDTWCPENHPAHTHRRVLAWRFHCKTNQTNINFCQFTVNKHWPQKPTKQCANAHTNHSHVAEIVTTKLLFIPAIFEAKSAVAKCKPPIATMQLHWFDLIVFPGPIPGK